MPEFGFDNNLLEIDAETVLRLLAITRVFNTGGKPGRTPGAVVADSVGHIHAALLKSNAAYSKIYNELIEEKHHLDKLKEEDNIPLRQVDYAVEFSDLDTGIESVFLKRKYRCPFCDTAFTAPSLKTGSLMMKVDRRTQMEVYTGVRQDSEKEFVDFSLFHILICPTCLYASQEKDFDIWDAGAKNPDWVKRKRVKVSQKIVDQFHKDLEKRMRIAQKAGDYGRDLFSTHRSEGDAAVALDLAAYALQFMIGRVSINRKSELMYNLGLLHLMKSLQYEKQLEDPELSGQLNEVKKNRFMSIRDALECFLKIPDTSVENFDIREGVRFNARKFWAAHELRHLQAFAQAGSALQRTYNQFTNLVKKAEREYQQEESKLKKYQEEIRKASNIQKREAWERQAKEVDKNLQLIRSGMENYRGVVRVVNPIYDQVSVVYDKFKEMQRQKRRATT